MAETVNIYQELVDLIVRIGQHRTFYGKQISPSIMKQFEIYVKEGHVGILVPYWLPVTQTGRPPRRNNKSSELWKIIYKWMAKRSMFRSKSEKGKINEAKFLTWRINKFGWKHFQAKAFVDIYSAEREKTIKTIMEKYSKKIGEITMQVV